MTPQVQDDGFHEIQLNGKQLVFLFMAATVVSVVIFLCGVLVGRGVKAERSVPAPTETSGLETEPPPAAPAAAPAQTASTDLSVTKPPPVPPELTYSDRLEDRNKKETLPRAAGTPPAQNVQNVPTVQKVQPRPRIRRQTTGAKVGPRQSRRSRKPAPPAPRGALRPGSVAR